MRAIRIATAPGKVWYWDMTYRRGRPHTSPCYGRTPPAVSRLTG